MRHTRLSALLLTRVAFETCGGMPSTVLACAEAARGAAGKLVVAGPRKLGLFMNALASYSEYVLQDLELDVRVRLRFVELPIQQAVPLIRRLAWAILRGRTW